MRGVGPGLLELRSAHPPAIIGDNYVEAVFAVRHDRQYPVRFRIRQSVLHGVLDDRLKDEFWNEAGSSCRFYLETRGDPTVRDRRLQFEIVADIFELSLKGDEPALLGNRLPQDVGERGDNPGYFLLAIHLGNTVDRFKDIVQKVRIYAGLERTIFGLDGTELRFVLARLFFGELTYCMGQSVDHRVESAGKLTDLVAPAQVHFLIQVSRRYQLNASGHLTEVPRDSRGEHPGQKKRNESGERAGNQQRLLNCDNPLQKIAPSYDRNKAEQLASRANGSGDCLRIAQLERGATVVRSRDSREGLPGYVCKTVFVSVDELANPVEYEERSASDRVVR